MKKYESMRGLGPLPARGAVIVRGPLASLPNPEPCCGRVHGLTPQHTLISYFGRKET